MLSDIAKSKFFTKVGIAALFLILILLGKELKKRYEINHEIQNLRNEIANLDAKNQETLNLINYFKTREFQERQARTLLGLQKPGEFAVALPFQETAASGDETSQKSQSSNLKKWWGYFFHAPR